MAKKDAKKINWSEFSQIAYSFYVTLKNHKRDIEVFEDTKQKFYDFADEYFKANNIVTGKVHLESKILKKLNASIANNSESEIVIQKIQKSNVKFDANKLEKVLDKPLRKRVINKTYEVSDISGLIAYLKELGADPEIFKSFLTISKSVNIRELENLESLGEISLDELKGTYTVNTSKPYFTFRVEEGQIE